MCNCEIEYVPTINNNKSLPIQCCECYDWILPREQCTKISGEWNYDDFRSAYMCDRCSKIFYHFQKIGIDVEPEELYSEIWKLTETDIITRQHQCLIDTGIDWLKRGKGGKFEFVEINAISVI